MGAVLGLPIRLQEKPKGAPREAQCGLSYGAMAQRLRAQGQAWKDGLSPAAKKMVAMGRFKSEMPVWIGKNGDGGDPKQKDPRTQMRV